MDLAITVVQREKAVTATTDMAKAGTTMAIIVMVTMEIMVTGMVTVVTVMVTKVPAMVNRLMGAREAVMVREAAMERDLIILAMAVEPMIMAIMVITDIPDMASIMTLVKNQITAGDTKIIIK